jgi:hypothetical protein
MMKKAIPFILCALIFGCRSEQDVEPANEPTFLRYFGSEHSHTAHLAIEADNGYSLLSTIQIPKDNLGNFVYKIRIIHTDTYGNVVWNKEYPSFADDNGNIGANGSYKGSSFINTGSGYLIIGERINDDGSSDLHLIETDFDGNVQHEKDITDPQHSMHGKAVTMDSDGNYIVLGGISGDTNDMYVAKINADDLTTTAPPVWSRKYGAGSGTLVNRIFINGSDKRLSWTGSISLTNFSAIRFIQAPEDSEGTDNGNLLGDDDSNESASDFCAIPGGYVIVGTTDKSEKDNTIGDDNIYLTKVSPDGTRQSAVIFDFDGQNDRGNSICPGVESGTLVLATVESGSSKGNGKEDFYLLKLDGRFAQEWTEGINYGGLDNEEGASVISTSDRGYLVFGTTYFGNLKKLALMKVNKDGKL